MSLLEAFQQCAPRIGDPAVDEVRDAAGARIYEQLVALARRYRDDTGILEDAALTVWSRFVQAGPRPPRPDAPDSDRRVRGYLRSALRNERIAQLRRLKREAPLEEAGVPETGATPFHEFLEEDDREPEQGRLVQQAVARLFEEIAPQAAAAMKAPFGQSFLEAIRVRRDVARGATTYEKTATGELNKQARDRFDQQQSRAMKRLFAAVEAFLAERELSSPEAQALRGVFRALKDMELRWPVSGDVKS